MKLNTTIAMGLIALAALSFSACDDSKSTDAGATKKATAAPATTGPVIRVLDENGMPITNSVTVVITCPNSNVIRLKTADDGTVALPTDKVAYPASFTAEGEGHTYITRQIPSAASIYGNKVVILQK
jgi:hypothetical protein